MKKILNFLTQTERGEKSFLIFSNAWQIVVIASTTVAFVLMSPVFWMWEKYNGTWMNATFGYFLLPFFFFGAIVMFIHAPYYWYLGTRKYSRDDTWGYCGVAIILSLFPGAVFSKIFLTSVNIPITDGIHNLLYMLLFGVLYLAVMKTVFKKQFEVVKEYFPLS